MRPLAVLALLISASVLPVAAARAQAPAGPGELPFLSTLFTDNMVLQRGMADPVWGWTTPGARVTVSMNGKTASASAGPDGKWMARIGPFTAGGPYTLTVDGPQKAEVHNVLVGDVWICSGQSNMEFGIGNAINAQQEIATADYPQIRLYTLPKTIAFAPRATTVGQWDVCTPQTISAGGWNGFSAVAYFFGRDLYQKLHVPIGLIHTSWGGTVAEAWTSAEALDRHMPTFRPAVASVAEMRGSAPMTQAGYARRMADWYAKNDPGSANGHAWAAPDFGAAGWKTMNLPTAWEDAGLPDYDGVVWFRKEVNLPASAAGQAAELRLGPIDDQDTTWLNGVQVGATGVYNAARDYQVPAGVLKPGRNVIAVRVLDTGGAGGLNGTPQQMSLRIPGQPPISLAGPWLYDASAPLSKTQPVPQMVGANNPNIATVLYKGMIAPLIPFGIKGAIWYQGESNADRAFQYRSLLPTMITDWRHRWGEGDFPFFIVQLANFMATKPEPSEDAWAELREAQLMTAETLPKTGLAVITDIGDAKDIHPKNKQEVGRRLALAALAIAYGQKGEYSGPLYRAMKKEGSSIRLTFDHVDGGLDARGDKLEGFAIAGPDRHFVWADARIEGNSIVVSSPQVPDPVAVRYAWASNPVANLYNKTGLPASPFRTDNWPGITVGHK